MTGCQLTERHTATASKAGSFLTWKAKRNRCGQHCPVGPGGSGAVEPMPSVISSHQVLVAPWCPAAATRPPWLHGAQQQPPSPHGSMRPSGGWQAIMAPWRSAAATGPSQSHGTQWHQPGARGHTGLSCCCHVFC